MGNLAKIPEFDKAFWKHLGDEICDEIRVQTQVNSKDVHNRKFKAYKKHAPFWFSKKINVVYEKDINFTSGELSLDTAFNAAAQAKQPIDLGVFKVSGTKKEDNELP